MDGHWYPAESSHQHRARLTVLGERFELQIDAHPKRRGLINELTVSARVGDITRRLRLADGSLFETRDNDAVDAMLHSAGHRHRGHGLLHSLETRWRWIGSALVLTIALGFAFLRWGLPWLSELGAKAMPQVATEKISTGTLDLLDRLLLEPSTLPEDRRRSLNEHFRSALVNRLPEPHAYRLHFRHMDGIPNAFALPSGDIVITDALVELAENQPQIDSVLLHEIGHVVQRHGLQQVIRSSFLTVLIAFMSGDATAAEELVVGLPIFLMESRYSREHEAEADQYAFENMIALDIDPIHFGQIMALMTAADDSEDLPRNEQHASGDDIPEFLSTHPATRSRIEVAAEWSKRFREGKAR